MDEATLPLQEPEGPAPAIPVPRDTSPFAPWAAPIQTQSCGFAADRGLLRPGKKRVPGACPPMLPPPRGHRPDVDSVPRLHCNSGQSLPGGRGVGQTLALRVPLGAPRACPEVLALWEKAAPVRTLPKPLGTDLVSPVPQPALCTPQRSFRDSGSCPGGRPQCGREGRKPGTAFKAAGRNGVVGRWGNQAVARAYPRW